MKKVILLCLFFVVVFAGCSSSEQKSNLTLDDFVKAYKESGEKIELKEKPIFQMIGAEDGVRLDFNGDKVAIYKYKSEKELEKAKSTNDLIKDWITKGPFLLETNNEKAKEIFKNVK